jgi:hypothetical protein
LRLAPEPYPRAMSEEPVTVTTDGLRAASEYARSWEQAVERVETVAVLAHGKHVADVVPSGELERLRETIDVLSVRQMICSASCAAA